MNDDVRKTIYATLIIFIFGVLVWVSFIFVNACGFTLTCKQGDLLVERTPMPTLIPATFPVVQPGNSVVGGADQCRVAATDLLGAWVATGASETEAFEFTDINSLNCEATFADVKPLFVDANLWYAGSRSCASCHFTDLTTAAAQLDLSNYAGVTSGSRRVDAGSTGKDILGGGSWESSLLLNFISSNHDVPGHITSVPELVIFAGTPLTPVP